MAAGKGTSWARCSRGDGEGLAAGLGDSPGFSHLAPARAASLVPPLTLLSLDVPASDEIHAHFQNFNGLVNFDKIQKRTEQGKTQSRANERLACPAAFLRHPPAPVPAVNLPRGHARAPSGCTVHEPPRPHQGSRRCSRPIPTGPSIPGCSAPLCPCRGRRSQGRGAEAGPGTAAAAEG